MERAAAAFEAWKQADTDARAAEGRLREAWERYDARSGPAPAEELMTEVSRLRGVANEKLALAMAAMGREPQRPQ